MSENWISNITIIKGILCTFWIILMNFIDILFSLKGWERDNKLEYFISEYTFVIPQFKPLGILIVHDVNIVWNHGKELKAKALSLINFFV